MIDREVFTREMALLIDRFNRPFSKPVAARYYEILCEHLDTGDFELAARLAFARETYFPAPLRLVELVQPSAKVAAGEEWERVLEAVRRGSGAELSPAGQRALKEVGGLWRIGHSDELTQLPWIKREFVQAFEEFVQSRHRTDLRKQLEAGAKQLGLGGRELPS